MWPQPDAAIARSAASRAHRSASASDSPRELVGSLVGVDDPLDRLDDAEERQPALVEGVDGLLVGRVEDGRDRCRRRARPAWRAAPPGRPTSSRGSKVQLDATVQSSGRPTPAHPVRPVEAERDRQAHVGRRGLRDRRAVDELDHRVHDRLRMHDDVDVAVRDAEQQVRLDHLEALVDERRGVGGDDAAHVPGRVRERLGRSDVGERLAACARGTGRRMPSARVAAPRRARPIAAPARSRSARSRPERSDPAARAR